MMRKISMISVFALTAATFAMTAYGQTVLRTTAQPVTIDASAKDAATRKLPVKLSAAEILNQPDSNTIKTSEGQVMTVGEIREQLRAEIADTPQGQTQTTTAIKPASDTMRAAIIDRKKGGALRAMDIPVVDKSVYTRGCEPTDPARIIRVLGDVSPGSSLAIPGNCFGLSNGEVRLHGPFPTGYRVLPVNSWAANRITVQVPSIIGVGAEPMRVEVIRADKQASNGVEVTFSPKMSEVDVSNLWRGACVKTGRWADVACPANRGVFASFYEGARILIGDLVSQNDYPRKSTWTLEVNPQCYLVSASWSGASRFDGWEQGPAHKAVVQVEGILSDDLHDSGFWTDTRRVSMNMTFGATAMCPQGISPATSPLS